MKLIVNDNIIAEPYKNTFCIKLTFMFGDADGSETQEFYVSDKEYQNKPDELHDFIRHLQSAIDIDSDGRLGIETFKELIDWYANGKERGGRNKKGVYRWRYYVENVYELNDTSEYEYGDSIINGQFMYYIPYSDFYWYASYDSFEIIYYDNEGYSHNVEIVENKISIEDIEALKINCLTDNTILLKYLFNYDEITYLINTYGHLPLQDFKNIVLDIIYEDDSVIDIIFNECDILNTKFSII